MDPMYNDIGGDVIKETVENGILCLLHQVNRIDNENYKNDIKYNITDGAEIIPLLQQNFLGQYYNNRRNFPINLKTAQLLHRYIKWIESKNEKTFQIAYLYLFGYSSFIEISDPLILIFNCISYLNNPSNTNIFDFDILKKYHSVFEIIAEIEKNISKIKTNHPNIHSELNEFVRMMEMFNFLFDKRLRNSIAHSDYLVKQDWKVLVRSKGVSYTYDVADVKRLYDLAYIYLQGYQNSINKFSNKLLPGVDISFSWGENY